MDNPSGYHALTMKKDAARIAAVSVLGIAFWAVASLTLGKGEPWDSPHYLAWFGAALALSGALGGVLPRGAWRWGALMIFGQLPVMAFQAGVGPLAPVGIGVLVLEAMPACLISIAASLARVRWLRRRP